MDSRMGLASVAETTDVTAIEVSNASQSPLLRLPTEVRLHILNYVLTPPDPTLLEPEDTAHIHLFNLKRSPVSQRNLDSTGDKHWKQSRAVLSTCRWIRAEGQDIFYRHNTFVLQGPLVKVTQSKGTWWCTRWVTPLRFTTLQDFEAEQQPFNPLASTPYMPDNHVPHTILKCIQHAIFLTTLNMDPRALCYYRTWPPTAHKDENFFTLEIVDLRPFQAMTHLQTLHTYLWAAFDYVSNTCYPGPTQPMRPSQFHQGDYPITPNALRPLQALCEAVPAQCLVKFDSLRKLRQREPGATIAWCGPHGDDKKYKSEMAHRLLDCFTQNRQVKGVMIARDQGMLTGSEFDHRICGHNYKAARACPVAVPGVNKGCVHARMRLIAFAASRQKKQELQESDDELRAKEAAAIAAARPPPRAPKKLPWVDQLYIA
ncbi:hypothetical protein K431DRAFT_309177 [Polychaeton citri CBS 116435]|uniref:F-box domain-containing protein n=1 Tax=Polychaeton citri CBS 116435 TaxID=1314669 RepID=A0A9P4QH99_9PEZI|nr:hypothetical protein K431DRAFT_309177 [Polychaeton citri CBS 116435]